jgi:DNA (cytosine-5)-methyltransferase 1
MAPSSPSPAVPTRVSGRKHAAKAEEIHQNQEEEEVMATSSAKRSRKAASFGKKPKPMPK